MQSHLPYKAIFRGNLAHTSAVLGIGPLSDLAGGLFDDDNGAATAALWELFGLPQQEREDDANQRSGDDCTGAQLSVEEASADEHHVTEFNICQLLLNEQAAPQPGFKGDEPAPAPGDQEITSTSVGRIATDAAQEGKAAQPVRRTLKRARSSEEDEDDFLIRASQKRGRRSATAAKSQGAGDQNYPAHRQSRATHETPGASTSRQPVTSSVTVSSRSSAAPARPSKPMEECNASHVIKAYADRRAALIEQTANIILALGPLQNDSQLPPRKHLTPAHRELLRSIGRKLVTKRRATVADPGYYACTECETDYGLKDEPILERRKAAHTLAYHTNRMCSACGLLVNGRELKQSREHRQRCPIWRALVAKGMHKDWLRARGFYDKGSTREFWMAKQVRQARQQATVAGDPALLVQYLEQELEAAEVQALRTAIQAEARASQPSAIGDATGSNEPEDAAAALYTVQNEPSSELYGSVQHPEQDQGARYDLGRQTYAATWQLWNPQPEAGPSEGFSGPSAPTSTELPPAPGAQYTSMPPAAPTYYVYDTVLQSTTDGTLLDARGLEGYQFDGRTLSYHGVPVHGAGVLDTDDQASGGADQGRDDSGSANAAVDGEPWANVDAVPTAQESSHLDDIDASDNSEPVKGYFGPWVDDESDLYA
ncbi:hypothetical protein AURDEDRAFT_159273 [Auricularia subglabra TFB-10046 SS5]|nr:hypothetical protein AURDEDRAFT_159273 [Auricularia subglabra TFB-10046 SS5]